MNAIAKVIKKIRTKILTSLVYQCNNKRTQKLWLKISEARYLRKIHAIVFNALVEMHDRQQIFYQYKSMPFKKRQKGSLIIDAYELQCNLKGKTNMSYFTQNQVLNTLVREHVIGIYPVQHTRKEKHPNGRDTITPRTRKFRVVLNVAKTKLNYKPINTNKHGQ